MKKLTLILLPLIIGNTSAYLIKVPTLPTQPKIEPVGWVHIQKLMLPLFENVCDESNNPVVLRLAKEFTLDPTDYTKADVVDTFNSLKSSQGLLPKGEIFTEYNTNHLAQFKALYELFYYAKNFDSFYKVASWARMNINCGLFVNSLYLAVINRRDTLKISVPAPYELLPNYFINKDVVIKASQLLSEGEIVPADDVRVEGNAYILDAKYTADIDADDEDSKLAYFREDIGLNSYYFLRKLRNAPWFNVPLSTDNLYGEYMYLMMKQFAARYDLERYSHGLPELEGISWNTTIDPYDPLLIYTNGNEFGHRTFAGTLSNTEELTIVETIENNFASVVTHLRQAGQNKTQILNHLMEILFTSERNYEKFARLLLGSDSSSGERQLSVLDHYLTSMRDPVFWKINKKIVQMVDNALKELPGYTRNELYFPGVEVLNIETKKIMTLFDNYQFDVTDSLKTSSENTTFQVKIEQSRLNHKPFVMKLNITSLVTQKGLVKIYIGPKTMPGELILKKNLFVLLERFEINLKRGSNIISRSSEEMKSYSDDFISLQTLRKKVEDAEFGLDALPLKEVESQVGYPTRLILPKGLPEGLPLQIFVFVAPFYRNVGLSTTKEFNSVVLSPGYPLDLFIEDKTLFSLPNALVKDVAVIHKGGAKAGSYGEKTGPKNWGSDKTYGSKFDYSANKGDFNEVTDDAIQYEYYDIATEDQHGLLGDRPEFTYRKKDATDYTSKQNQYQNKKEDYASKRAMFPKRDFSNKNEEKKPDMLTTERDLLNEGQVDYLKVSPLSNTSIPTKIHGLLGARPDFTYKNKNYTDKQNQYRNKIDYESKRTEYKKRVPEKKEVVAIDLNKTDNEKTDETNRFKTTNYPYKYISINNENNTVIKNITEDSSAKDFTINKINSKKFDTITKDIKEIPVDQNVDIDLKKYEKYDFQKDEGIEDNTKTSEFAIVYEPIIVPVDMPKRRFSVYDFLINSLDQDEKVYE